jgi:hypothetical protein
MKTATILIITVLIVEAFTLLLRMITLFENRMEEKCKALVDMLRIENRACLWPQIMCISYLIVSLDATHKTIYNGTALLVLASNSFYLMYTINRSGSIPRWALILVILVCVAQFVTFSVYALSYLPKTDHYGYSTASALTSTFVGISCMASSRRWSFQVPNSSDRYDTTNGIDWSNSRFQFHIRDSWVPFFSNLAGSAVLLVSPDMPELVAVVYASVYLGISGCCLGIYAKYKCCTPKHQ